MEKKFLCMYSDQGDDRKSSKNDRLRNLTIITADFELEVKCEKLLFGKLCAM